MQNIFLVEDDNSLINGLVFALEKQGYTVYAAKSKSEALEHWDSTKYGLVILDVTLPDGNGYEICKYIRQESMVPIIFLTAADEETDVLMGLDIGGDDYITKPFKLSELFARMNALIRRCNYRQSTEQEITSHGIRVLPLEGKVYKGNEIVDLTLGEYKLLKYFMENEGIVLSAEQILAALWDSREKFVDTNTLTVYIRRLRMKIEENPAKPKRIVTVRGMGYKWNGEENK